MRAHNAAQNIVGILNAFGPYAQRFVYCILQGTGAAAYRHNLRTQKLHAEHVERLTLAVLLAHVNNAFHVHQRRCGSSRNTVLACAGFSDNALFAHLLRQQNLSQYVVDFVGAGVVQILALQINLAATQILGHLLCVIQEGRSVGIFAVQARQLSLEFGIVFKFFICSL